MKWALIIGAILLVLAVGVVGCSALVVSRTADTIRNATGSANPADYELTLESCSLVDGVAQAQGTFTNRSDKRQGFQINVEFTDESGSLIGNGIEIVGALAPGGATDWSTSPSDLTDAQVIQCTVTDVSYTLFDQ